MPAAARPANESSRLKALKSLDILDTLPEKEYDQIVTLAARICDVPIALVSLVDSERQWFKARTGIDAESTHRDVAFCAHALLAPDETLVVEDATCDQRFSDNPLVTDEPGIRFYAGVPLCDADGHALGTLCAIDMQPKKFSELQKHSLNILAANVESLLQLRKARQEQEKLIELLQQKNDELEQFSYRSSHDLKAPVVTIRGIVRFILKDLEREDYAEVISNLNKISQQCEKIEKLVTDVLNLTKADYVSSQYEEIQLHPLIQNIIDELEFISHTKSVSINNAIPVDAAVYAEPFRLKQVIENLLANAITYSDPSKQKPCVEVSLNGQDRFDCITVTDNGLGIPVEKHDQVFNMFSRFHPEHAGGSGLGLAITWKHVKSMGGKIRFSSDDGGTRFSVSLLKRRYQDEIINTYC